MEFIQARSLERCIHRFRSGMGDKRTHMRPRTDHAVATHALYKRKRPRGWRPSCVRGTTAVGETKQRDKEIESMKGGKEGGDGEGRRVHHPPHP